MKSEKNGEDFSNKPRDVVYKHTKKGRPPIALYAFLSQIVVKGMRALPVPFLFSLLPLLTSLESLPSLCVLSLVIGIVVVPLLTLLSHHLVHFPQLSSLL